MDVDVLILSLNRAPETCAAIDSAQAQRGVRVRIVVVDQGSDPAAFEAIARHVQGAENVVLKRLDQNIGVPAGRNRAAALGDAPVLVALDNDAEFADETVLARACALLRKHDEYSALGFRILNYFTGDDDHTSWGYSHLDWARRMLDFPALSFVGAGHAIRRAAFEAAGGYDERLFFCAEELDLGFKILKQGGEIRYRGDLVVRHKVSPEGRVRWRDGRYYYTLRNRLYLGLKYESSKRRFVERLGGLVLRGVREGMVIDALRGLVGSFRLHAQLRREEPDWRRYRLTAAERARADWLNHRSAYSFWDRLRNSWTAADEVGRARDAGERVDEQAVEPGPHVPIKF